MSNKYLVFRGYDKIGEAACLDGAKAICREYCEKTGVSFKLKREFSSGTDVTVLIFQYRTLYLETFVITEGYELEDTN